MNKLVWIFLTSLVLSAASIDPKGDKEVLAAMDAYKEAMTHKDGAALEKLLSSDLTYTHSAGQLETKAASQLRAAKPSSNGSISPILRCGYMVRPRW